MMKNYIQKYLYIKKVSILFNINKNILILQLISLNKNIFFEKKSLSYENNIYIDIINYKYNFIKNFYKKYIPNLNFKKKVIIYKKYNKCIKYNNKIFYIEKYIINILIIYYIQYIIFNKYKKTFFYIKNYFKKKKIIFLNKNYSLIYKNIIYNNKNFLKKKIIDFYIKKYFIYKKKKNIKKICNIIYYKYKIFRINFNIKKYTIYNNKSIKKIICLIKKKNKYKKKINFFYNK
ncbi:MAG: hypothetical protein V9V01_00770 [Candidatus Shikimatogenerans sp. Tmey]